MLSQFQENRVALKDILSLPGVPGVLLLQFIAETMRLLERDDPVSMISKCLQLVLCIFCSLNKSRGETLSNIECQT